jgi:hypothetical protein
VLWCLLLIKGEHFAVSKEKIQDHPVVVCEGSVLMLDDKINDGNILLESNAV